MSVRVIAGTFRSRSLVTPAGQATRPTAARAREALFSILGNLEGLHVLDLYAGSGALGIEALSRGAARATFVERERRAIECIQKNIAALGLGERAQLLPLDVARAEQRLLAGGERFELVLCDPPWRDVERAATQVWALRALFADSARVVFEHPRGQPPTLGELQPSDERTWGDTAVSIFMYQRPNAAQSGEP